MTVRVFYQSWQMQCCGVPFRVGDNVTWTVLEAHDELATAFGPIEGADIAWLEEHHQEDDPMQTVTGTVVGIRSINQRFRRRWPGRNMFVGVDGDLVAADLESADGWESGDDDANPTGYSFTGYVVTLS